MSLRIFFTEMVTFTNCILKYAGKPKVVLTFHGTSYYALDYDRMNLRFIKLLSTYVHLVPSITGKVSA